MASSRTPGMQNSHAGTTGSNVKTAVATVLIYTKCTPAALRASHMKREWKRASMREETKTPRRALLKAVLVRALVVSESGSTLTAMVRGSVSRPSRKKSRPMKTKNWSVKVTAPACIIAVKTPSAFLNLMSGWIGAYNVQVIFIWDKLECGNDCKSALWMMSRPLMMV